MEQAQWVSGCSARLHEQWPRVELDHLEHLAQALWNEDRWRGLPPDEAAVQWLSQGIPLRQG